MERRNSKSSSYSYNYKNYKGNYLTPFLETKTVIIVYVHGFLGNNNTFHEFPDLLKESLKLYNVRVINKVFPAFETNGVFDDFVNMIIDWLYENTKDYPIILMGHSMGGILNADVYRKISKDEVEFKHRNEKPPKIVAVFGFDTPFFGLSSAVANGGIRKIKESILSATDYAANYLTSFLSNKDDYNESSLNDNSTNNKSNEKNKEERYVVTKPISNSNNSIRSTYDNASSSINKSEGRKKWNILKDTVLTTATIAAIGTSLLHQGTRQAAIVAGQQIIADSTQYLTNYARFLEPLIEVSKQHQRVDDLINSARRSIICGKERFKFKNYYPITQKYNNDGSIQKSTFVCLPQEMRYLKYFDSVPGPKDSPDPVYSHTKMFNSRLNNENVHILADKCLIDLYKVIRTLY